MGRRKSPVTWQDAARLLHQINPKLYDTGALGRIFKKNNGTVWWALHPEWQREFDRERKKNPKEYARRKARHERLKNDPEYKAKRAATCKRYRERKKNEMGGSRVLHPQADFLPVGAGDRGCHQPEPR